MKRLATFVLAITLAPAAQAQNQDDFFGFSATSATALSADLNGMALTPTAGTLSFDGNWESMTSSTAPSTQLELHAEELALDQILGVLWTANVGDDNGTPLVSEGALATELGYSFYTLAGDGSGLFATVTEFSVDGHEGFVLMTGRGPDAGEGAGTAVAWVGISVGVGTDILEFKPSTSTDVLGLMPYRAGLGSALGLDPAVDGDVLDAIIELRNGMGLILVGLEETLFKLDVEGLY